VLPARIAAAHASRTANAMARRQRTCEQCGAGFTMANLSGKARAGRSQEGRFCSRPCAIAGMRKPVCEQADV
jgi:hypothetical protein